MAQSTHYDWDVETLDPDSGDILDHYHMDKLAQEQALDESTESLVLVRDTWDSDRGLIDRTHWYPLESNDLEFSNGVSVPERFINEFNQWSLNRHDTKKP